MRVSSKLGNLEIRILDFVSRGELYKFTESEILIPQLGRASGFRKSFRLGCLVLAHFIVFFSEIPYIMLSPLRNHILQYRNEKRTPLCMILEKRKTFYSGDCMPFSLVFPFSEGRGFSWAIFLRKFPYALLF